MSNEYMLGRIKEKVGVFFKYLFLILITAISLVPIVWVFISSFKSNTEIMVNSFGLPVEWITKNVKQVFTSPNLISGYVNTLITGGLVLLFTTVLGSMTAYVSSRRMKSSWLHSYYALGIMIPMQAILIPTFLVLKFLGITYTRTGIVLAYVAATMPITVFVLHGFMGGIPKEMDEAATIDGCSPFRTFWAVIMPISKPGLATVLTLNLLTVWNDYLFSLVIGGSKYYNITVVINNFKGQPDTAIEYGLVCAGLMFSILPLAIVYIILQENVIRGMSEGAIKA